jgi:isocitrate/isopropylmalate dehydrogenase
MPIANTVYDIPGANMSHLVRCLVTAIAASVKAFDSEGGCMKRIVVIPGDGVGPEVVKESEKVLRHVSALDPQVELIFDRHSWGTDNYLATGEMMPPDALDILRGCDAILFGAVGSPSVKDHITLRQLLLKIRFAFDYYVNLRPVRLLDGVTSPIVGVAQSDVDMVFVREGTEGEYAGVGDRIYPGTEREVALQTAVFSRFGTGVRAGSAGGTFGHEREQGQRPQLLGCSLG